MKKRLLVLWSVLGLLIPYFLPASIVVAEEIETSRGIYFLSEPTEQVDFSTEKEQLSEIFQEEDWVFLNPINIRFYVEGQLDYQKYFPVFKDGDFHQLIDESSWQLAPSEVADFIQNHSKTTKPTSPMTFIIVNYAWYGFFDETWYDLYLNEPADLSELLSDLEETIIIRDLFTDYQDQVKQEQSNQKALESSQQSTSSREETNHDFSTSTESQENKQSEESKENVEGISKEKHKDSDAIEKEQNSLNQEIELNVYGENQKHIKDNDEIKKDTNNAKSISKDTFESEWGNIDYTQGLTETLNISGDIWSPTTGYHLKSEKLYFLIKSKNGWYAYTTQLFLANYKNVHISKTGTDRVYYKFIGGDHGDAEVLSINTRDTNIQFQFKPAFYKFYDVSKNESPCANQSLNYFLNWLHFWTDNEVSIVQGKTLLEMDNYVRELNSGIKYAPENIDFTQGLTESSNLSGDINVNYAGYEIRKSDVYFLIKSKNGKYAYANRIYRSSYKNISINKKGTDRVYYGRLGGNEGNAENIGHQNGTIPSIQFQFKPEFSIFYDLNKDEDPYRAEDLNSYLNWLNFWTDNEITIVQTDAIDLYVAQKNNDIQPWRFFKTGRQSIRDQTFSLTLDETTRLDFDMRGRSGQRLTVYQENETKVFDRKYSGYNNTVTLDLPAGSYYIAMTDITAETTLQIRRHQFNDFQLSIDTNPERTHIYLNGVFHQELTDIYAPHHRPLQLPTVVGVSNTLNSVWRTSRGSHPVLDAMFGKNYLLGTNLREQTFPTVGNLPLGSTSLSAPLQYVGNGQFYTDAQIVNFGPQQRFVITGSTLLLAMAGTLVVYYAAHLIHTNELQLTTPSIFREFETGSWEELEKFTYHGIVSYEGKTYGVNDETGEIKNTETGEELPKSVIPDDIRKSAAGASKLAINKILADLKRVGIDNIEDEYEWYTFKDLVQDELEGQGNKRGHTIEKHVMKSDAYLKNRLNTDNLLFSSTYYGVAEALIAINVTKLKHPEVFQNVGKQEGQFVKTPFELGKGYNSKNVLWSPLRNNQLYLMPSSSEKGFRVLTSYPVYKMGD